MFQGNGEEGSQVVMDLVAQIMEDGLQAEGRSKYIRFRALRR